MSTIVDDPRFLRANDRFVAAIASAQCLPHHARKMAEAVANRRLRASVAAICRWRRCGQAPGE